MHLKLRHLIFSYILIQLAVSFYCSSWSLSAWTINHLYLDSNWYMNLTLDGYVAPQGMEQGSQFAFFPLWPAILKIMSYIVPLKILHLFGALLSLALFFRTLLGLKKASQHSTTGQADAHNKYLSATNTLTLAPLVFSPGSWVFFSNHTEGMFLFFSFFAFHHAYKNKLIAASIFAGLAALTRNQGILVAISIGLVFVFNASSPETNWKHRAKKFITSGLISGAFFSLWLLFQYMKTGSIFASVEAQQHWKTATTISEYRSNFFWLSGNNAPRAFWFWAIWATSISILWKNRFKKNLYPIAIYMILSIVLWPLQGNNFPQAYRFGAVLFPFWLVLGHWINRLFTSGVMKKRIASIMILIFLMTASANLTSYYFLKSSWPY